MTILDGMRSATSETNGTNSNEHFQAYRKAASFVLSTLTAHKKESPKIGIVCGSGLSGLSSCLTDTLKISYASIPGFPVSIYVPICGNIYGSIHEAEIHQKQSNPFHAIYFLNIVDPSCFLFILFMPPHLLQRITRLWKAIKMNVSLDIYKVFQLYASEEDFISMRDMK